VAEFVADAETYGRVVDVSGIRIVFGTLGYSQADLIAGQTDLADGNITIDPNAWAVMTETQRKLIVYHELSHSRLHQVHRSNSIMSAVLISDASFEGAKDFYINELFAHLGE
jgi:Putative phage metallopeptidase